MIMSSTFRLGVQTLVLVCGTWVTEQTVSRFVLMLLGLGWVYWAHVIWLLELGCVCVCVFRVSARGFESESGGIWAGTL